MTAPDVIRYGFTQTSIAALLVAVSAKGLVAVLMRERADDQALEAALAQRFPKSDRVPADQDARAAVEAVSSFVERPSRNIALPLDIRATDFATRVYRAVLDIPFGQTRTFAEVAQGVGAPRAIRAVGAACARNPIEFAIPCHRVRRSDGRWAGGGAWGDWRQSVIVGREKAALAAAPEGELR